MQAGGIKRFEYPRPVLLDRLGQVPKSRQAAALRPMQPDAQSVGLPRAHPTQSQAGKPLSACQKKRNGRIAKTRARVEHPFAQIRHMGGKLIRTIGQARATVAMTMMATCYNIKRLVMLLDKQVDAFYRQGETSKTALRLQGVNG